MTQASGRVSPERTWRASLRRPEALTAILAWTALAITLLITSALVARRPVSSIEVEIFRAANDLPHWLNTAIWPLMQYGTFLTIPVLAVVALAFRRVRLAVAMLLAGVGVYLLAKLVKGLVDRGRPGAVLVGINERETFGVGSLGFPSGHAAVAGALTFVVWRHLGPRWGAAALGVAIIVMLGRMYVGAHLPLDLVGGAALGAVTAGIANVVAPPAPPGADLRAG
jgi:undecaprenyl-diphosphatase